MKRGIPSKTARGRYLSALLMVAGTLFAVLYADVPEWLRISLIAIALGCTPIVYSLGPAVLAEVVPVPQRGSMDSGTTTPPRLGGRDERDSCVDRQREGRSFHASRQTSRQA